MDFVGRRGALFGLALRTGILTILTLGFYRFWMKTRLRRWYWSAMRPGGHPLEYVGDPFEKLLGFFIAVVVLTFYIGILNLLLMFVSFSVFSSSWVGYAASFAGVIPLWFYARYRARRYVLGRTRWRAVRFGLEKGAWGYAGRALWYWFLTVISLGILWPRMTFLLEKYKTDRTYFGSARLVQGGSWTMLYRAAWPFLGGVLLTALLLLWVMVLDPVLPERAMEDGEIWRTLEFMVDGGRLFYEWNAPERLWLFTLSLSVVGYGLIHYRWVTKRIMANHKTAPGISFASGLSGTRVAMIYSLGIFISYMALVIGVLMLILAAFGIFGTQIVESYLGIQMGGMDLPRWLSFGILGVLYLFVFLMWGVLHNTFVTFPLMRHMALTTTLPNANGLTRVSQRERDAFAEAEGFAEALDLGAAI
ncbi:DUF898 family protein [Sulfitobacter sp. JB4-11]|uniref:DUF898 family protein n=1 Tax=Sulfitobacter rhodophyticola TaxID=3238304 RepID=UPI003A766E6E